jgi:hypothetical protein
MKNFGKRFMSAIGKDAFIFTIGVIPTLVSDLDMRAQVNAVRRDVKENMTT